MQSTLRTVSRLVVAASVTIAVACTASTSPAPTPTPAAGETRDVPAEQASGLVMGSFATTVSGAFRVTVNDQVDDVVVAPDGTFVVRAIPSGRVTLLCDLAGKEGSVTVDDVQPGEVIEIRRSRRGGRSRHRHRLE